MGDVEIRRATERDVSALDSLYKSAGWSSVGRIRRRDRFLVGHVGRKSLVGAAMFWVEDADAACDGDAPYAGVQRLLLQEIVVDGRARLTGAGRHLMAAVASAAQELDVEWIRAWPSPRGDDTDRDGRIRFFERCGMVRRTTADGHLEVHGSVQTIAAHTSAK